MTLPTDAKAREEFPVATGSLDYFPKAIAEVALLSKIANEQHNPGEPMHWSKGKSTDHANKLLRHFMERGKRDSDGMRHRAKVAWRALADLEMEIEAEEAKMSYADYIKHLESLESNKPLVKSYPSQVGG
jgi:hypothetical protein